MDSSHAQQEAHEVLHVERSSNHSLVYNLPNHSDPTNLVVVFRPLEAAALARGPHRLQIPLSRL